MNLVVTVFDRKTVQMRILIKISYSLPAFDQAVRLGHHPELAGRRLQAGDLPAARRAAALRRLLPRLRHHVARLHGRGAQGAICEWSN